MAHLTRRKKRLKREAKAEREKQQLNQLFDYLRNYGEVESIQPANSALFDPQLKNLSLSLASEISSHPQGTVLDVGCGEGILLRRLTEIEAFKTNNRWIYFGVDYEENHGRVVQLAMELGVHRRVDVCSLDDFYTDWPRVDRAPRPYIFVVRNVFHELDIDQTARLLDRADANLGQDDVLLFQDLQVFPVSERGNACWLPRHFDRLLSTIGFTTTFVEEPTARGNRWFTIVGRKHSVSSSSFDAILAAVVCERTKQFLYWRDLGWLVPDDEKFREVRLAKLDFDLQCGALQQQLLRAKVPAIPPPSRKQEALIIKKTFAKHLTTFHLDALPSHIPSLAQVNPFRDRAHDQNNLETFLRDDSAVIVIRGGAFVGKTALVKEVLTRRAYGKQVVMLDVHATSSIWNLIEQFLIGLGCKFESDLYGTLKRINFYDIENEIEQLLQGLSDKIIIVIDHFERLLDPHNNVQDGEIRAFLALIAHAPRSKVIITTRQMPDLHFIRSERMSQSGGSSVGRFPKGDHVENVLDDFVDRSQLDIDKYPDALLEAIDRHPYLTVLAGMTIRKEGKPSLDDKEFLERLRKQMRESLLRRVLDDRSQQAIDVLSMLRIPVPRQMLESLVGNANVGAAEDAGLVYGVFDRLRSDLVKGLGVLRRYRTDLDDYSLADDTYNPDRARDLAKEHKRFADWYERLYRTDHDPRWIREVHYHRLATGDSDQIERFGALFRDEIFWAGDYWYRELKDYRSALWAFEAARALGLTTAHTEMRRASCMMRLRDPRGEQVFADLIARYATVKIKSAHIDSLLFLERYEDALSKLLEYGLSEHDRSWIAHEYGRTYFGLHRYTEAIRAFEIQLDKEREPEAFVYDSLARAYQSVGDHNNESRVLNDGLRRHPNNVRLKLRYASHLIRLGTPDAFTEADPILQRLCESYPTDGRILQQYCKLLCCTNNADQAEEIWRVRKNTIRPSEYKVPIYVEILMRKEDWTGALDELKDVPTDNEHLIGIKKEVYLAWAKSGVGGVNRRLIAKQGLAVKADPAFDNNIPLLITSARLARVANDDELYEEFAKKVETINPEVAKILRDDEEQLSYSLDNIFATRRS